MTGILVVPVVGSYAKLPLDKLDKRLRNLSEASAIDPIGAEAVNPHICKPVVGHELVTERPDRLLSRYFQFALNEVDSHTCIGVV